MPEMSKFLSKDIGDLSKLFGIVKGNLSKFMGIDLTEPLPGKIWNSADKHATISLENDDKTAVSDAGSPNKMIRSFGRKYTGKWYFEVDCEVMPAATCFVGIATPSESLNWYVGRSTGGWGYWLGAGFKVWNTHWTSGGATFAEGDVVGIAVDADNGKMWFAKNGVWQTGDPAAGTNPAFPNDGGDLGPSGGPLPACTPDKLGDKLTINANSEECSYTLPAGYSYWDDEDV